LALLAGARRALFERTANVDDLTWACQAADIALAETPAGHPSRPTRHTTLATCLLTRYETTGQSASLDEAVRHGKLAVRTANHSQVAVAATTLGNALLTRYELRHAATDIADAVHAAQRGVDSTPALSPFQRARQSNLGNALRAYANTHGDRDALRAAVIAGRRSVAIDTSAVPAIAAYWSNLALSYSDRFDLDAVPDDLDAAIQAATRAQSLSPPQHPSTALYNTNLAMLLRTRYRARRVRHDIDTAIALLTAAAESTSETHPHYGALHLALGNAHYSRYEGFGHYADYAAAQQHWTQACSSTAPPSTRLVAAESAAMRAYTQAVACVPIIAWQGLDRPGRELALRDIGSLAGASCAAALDAQQPRTALTNLETGRNVLWRQLTDLRADYRSLEELDSDTALRLKELGRLLDRPHTRD
jgi:tetratricopeptide (TPR) repeat protein